jgi:hypothetical protein
MNPPADGMLMILACMSAHPMPHMHGIESRCTSTIPARRMEH